jgi:alkanesulfonate monooxygenase SsuD/methylene tetrahydromethanopterin reductase-like flavin-dependent oxidoreductase (luciferase family)
MPPSSEQAQLADAAGYDSISFTEHHHIEGFELQQPGAARSLHRHVTKRIQRRRSASCCPPTIRSASLRYRDARSHEGGRANG